MVNKAKFYFSHYINFNVDITTVANLRRFASFWFSFCIFQHNTRSAVVQDNSPVCSLFFYAYFGNALGVVVTVVTELKCNFQGDRGPQGYPGEPGMPGPSGSPVS